MKISNYIRKVRLERQLLVREAASELAIDQGLLSKIENGIRQPTEEQLNDFATFYHLDLPKLKIHWQAEKILEILKKSVDAKKIAAVVTAELEKMDDEKNKGVDKPVSGNWLDDLMEQY